MGLQGCLQVLRLAAKLTLEHRVVLFVDLPTSVQVTRDAFGRYMRVIKRALTDAAAQESAKAAEVALAPSQTPSAADHSTSKQYECEASCTVQLGTES